jgi:hypothetical protein
LAKVSTTNHKLAITRKEAMSGSTMAEAETEVMSRHTIQQRAKRCKKNLEAILKRPFQQAIHHAEIHCLKIMVYQPTLSSPYKLISTKL